MTAAGHHVHHAVDLIRAKRDGGVLDDDAIDWFIRTYSDGAIPDEQAAALLMAIVWRGLDRRELERWTHAMAWSGARLDLGAVGRPCIGKHSTGGVGDKVSLVLVPLAAACGLAVPKLAGHALGHTGGTIDKLQSIPGLRTALSPKEIVAQLQSVGAVVAEAGDDLAPADRRLYTLRDVTGTVESVPLIAASIMAKKLAEGTAGLVLDVKVGSGSLTDDLDQATELARTMVDLGTEAGLPTTAVLTAMHAPLGRAVGNALEVDEARATLAGHGPADVVEVVVALAEEMLRLGGLDPSDPAHSPTAALRDGRATATWEAMVRAQGGDPDVRRPGDAVLATVDADGTGVVGHLDAQAVGVAAWRLGTGRARQGDEVDPDAGVVCRRKPGEAVTAGQPVLALHGRDPSRVPGALAALAGAWSVRAGPVAATPVVIGRVTSPDRAPSDGR